jgi:hypothetical protein
MKAQKDFLADLIDTIEAYVDAIAGLILSGWVPYDA